MTNGWTFGEPLPSTPDPVPGAIAPDAVVQRLLDYFGSAIIVGTAPGKVVVIHNKGSFLEAVGLSTTALDHFRAVTKFVPTSITPRNPT